MAIVRLVPAIVLALLLTSTAAELAASVTVSRAVTDGHRDLASKLGIRRLMQEQDSNCIPPMEVCCSNCGWFEHTNCCDPNTVRSYNPISDAAHGQDWCMPRNWDDLPKYAPCIKIPD